jgi:hypothetical protein
MLKQACQSCGIGFSPKRSWQSYCSEACANRDRQKRRRKAGKCRDTVSQPAECRDRALTTPRAPTPAKPEAVESYGWTTPAKPEAVESYGWVDDIPLKPSPLDGKRVLLGDDYPVTHDVNGYPKLPACLDRRALRKAKAA